MLFFSKKKLTGLIRIIVLVALLFFGARAYSSQGINDCGEASEMMRWLFNGGYAWVANMVDHRGLALQLYLDPQGNYIILGVDENLQACAILSGVDFKSVVMVDS